MATNDGHQNEVDIISFLDGKVIKELPVHFKDWLLTLFKNENAILRVSKLNNEQKADILVVCGKTKKYISIKSGSSNSFHSEQIETFIPFLRGIGVSEKTLKTLVFFHYGDNTLDGSGRIRFTSAELRKTHGVYFKRASDELSKKEVMEPLIERCIVKGRYENNYSIDGIYHGTPEKGFFLSTKMIYKILLRKSNIRKNGSINMQMLSYQPGSRNLWGIPGSERKRNNCEIKWRSFTKDALHQLKYDKNT